MTYQRWGAYGSLCRIYVGAPLVGAPYIIILLGVAQLWGHPHPNPPPEGEGITFNCVNLILFLNEKYAIGLAVHQLPYGLG